MPIVPQESVGKKKTSAGKISGIYSITCDLDSRTYIGSSVNIEKRWGDHRRALTKGHHHNIYLQRAWNKYGEQQFRFDIVELIECATRAQLLEREQWWMDSSCSWDHRFGFNIARFAVPTPLGTTRQYVVTTSEGEPILVANLHAFCREYDLNHSCMSHVLAGRRRSHRGYTIRYAQDDDNGAPLALRPSLRVKEYIAITPEGDMVQVSNLRAFCREHNLNRRGLHNTLTGKRELYKGYCVRYVGDIRLDLHPVR